MEQILETIVLEEMAVNAILNFGGLELEEVDLAPLRYWVSLIHLEPSLPLHILGKNQRQGQCTWVHILQQYMVCGLCRRFCCFHTLGDRLPICVVSYNALTSPP